MRFFPMKGTKINEKCTSLHYLKAKRLMCCHLLFWHPLFKAISVFCILNYQSSVVQN